MGKTRKHERKLNKTGKTRGNGKKRRKTIKFKDTEKTEIGGTRENEKNENSMEWIQFLQFLLHIFISLPSNLRKQKNWQSRFLMFFRNQLVHNLMVKMAMENVFKKCWIYLKFLEVEFSSFWIGKNIVFRIYFTKRVDICFLIHYLLLWYYNLKIVILCTFIYLTYIHNVS